MPAQAGIWWVFIAWGSARSYTVGFSFIPPKHSIARFSILSSNFFSVGDGPYRPIDRQILVRSI
jgi:hypothetical protein